MGEETLNTYNVGNYILFHFILGQHFREIYNFRVIIEKLQDTRFYCFLLQNCVSGQNLC